MSTLPKRAEKPAEYDLMGPVLGASKFIDQNTYRIKYFLTEKSSSTLPHGAAFYSPVGQFFKCIDFYKIIILYMQ